jgi:serine protease
LTPAADGAVFELIRLATALGVIVVEAAGNNKVPYDTFMDQSNLGKGNFLNRNSPQSSDSGAIMVGACNPPTVHGGMEAAKDRDMAIE